MPATTSASNGLWRVWRVAGGRRAEGLCPPENHTRPSTVTRGCVTRKLGGRRTAPATYRSTGHVLLWGPRQAGKSTLLSQLGLAAEFPDVPWVDLLRPETLPALSGQPHRLRRGSESGQAGAQRPSTTVLRRHQSADGSNSTAHPVPRRRIPAVFAESEGIPIPLHGPVDILHRQGENIVTIGRRGLVQLFTLHLRALRHRRSPARPCSPTDRTSGMLPCDLRWQPSKLCVLPHRSYGIYGSHRFDVAKHPH